MEVQRTSGRTCRIIGTSQKIKWRCGHDALGERSRSRWSVRLDVRVADDLLHLALSERTNAANSSGVSPATPSRWRAPGSSRPRRCRP